MLEEMHNEHGCCQKGGRCCKRGGRLALFIVGLVLLAGVLAVSILRDRFVNPQLRQVTITGQGRVAYVPDIAVVTLGVQIDKVAQPAEALNQLNGRMEAITKAVKDLGVEEKDINTQNYSLYPQYDYKDNVSTVSGYNANQQLAIKVRDYNENPGRLSQIIAAASKAGANQVNSLAFDSSRLNDLRQEARLAAIADAKSKSTALAEAAGVRLGRVMSWWENLYQPSYDYGKGGLGGVGSGVAVDPQIPSGNQEILVEMGVTYSLKK